MPAPDIEKEDGNFATTKWLPRDLKALLISMQISGIYHSPNNFPFKKNYDGNSKRNFVCLQHLWHLTCVGLMFSLMARTLVSIWWSELKIPLYGKIIYIVWAVQCFLNSTSFYLSIACKSRLPSFLNTGISTAMVVASSLIRNLSIGTGLESYP